MEAGKNKVSIMGDHHHTCTNKLARIIIIIIISFILRYHLFDVFSTYLPTYIMYVKKARSESIKNGVRVTAIVFVIVCCSFSLLTWQAPY